MTNKLRKAKEELRTVLAAWREERQQQDVHVEVQPPPRYDDVFVQGTRWLNGL